jgi:hypothetical protein
MRTFRRRASRKLFRRFSLVHSRQSCDLAIELPVVVRSLYVSARTNVRDMQFGRRFSALALIHFLFELRAMS